ncbi:flagellar basal body P-ring formation chaperone FlgA [Swingsia samuiensis]|uniref:flagellar basal body P-ring formation chaperone FlgA n=1 Tax=Swingsia samuiensis TaxID=1293412 RepID=UPI001C6599B6|nr:flagellar basal body P-ring formation chaperone FlgA [Swingsia samuiensis]
MSAESATLRTNVILNHPYVLLSDLFDGILPSEDRKIGAAPPLGTRYTIGGDQLTAIAAQFGVEWLDASPILSTTIERASYTINQSDLLPVIEEKLNFKENDYTKIELKEFVPIKIASNEFKGSQQINVHFCDDKHEDFQGEIKIPLSKEGELKIYPFEGVVIKKVLAVVARHDLYPGQSILAEDLEQKPIKYVSIDGEKELSVNDIVGLVAKKKIAAGHIMVASELIHPQLVSRGTPVVLLFASENLRVTISGIVLDEGGKGDIVHVYNALSKMILTGNVMSRSEVKVISGITPLSADERRLSMNRLPSL